MINAETQFDNWIAQLKSLGIAEELVADIESKREEYLAAIRKENLARGVNQNPELMEILDKLESIEVRDGVIRVVPKALD